MFKKKNNKASWETENTLTRTKDEDDSVAINTEQLVEKASFDWISRLKVLPVGLVAVFALAGAILTYVNYSTELDKNRQKTAYIADLRQLSERIDKSSILVRNADPQAFADLESSRNTIEKLLLVLQNGGIIEGNETSIDPISGEFAPRFNKIVQTWTNNKALINHLITQKNSLTSLKGEISKVDKNMENILDNAQGVQKSIENQGKIQSTVGQELVFLSSRIQQELDDLFSGESFSLQKGYAIVKDLKEFDYFIQSLKNGNEALGISAESDPQALDAIRNLEQSSASMLALAPKIVPQIGTLNGAKDVARQVSATSKSIITAAQELNSDFNNELNLLGKYRIFSIFLFLIALISSSLLALVFYERSLQAFRLAKVLQKNQANENAVNALLNQITPLDEGDFSQKVHVDDKFVLPISEKVDGTRKRFNNIVKQVKYTSEEVFEASKETENTSQKLLEVSEEQYKKMGESIDKIGKMTSSMDELAQITWVAQEESQSSRQASIEGESLVRQSVEKMDEIRHTIQESSKKIKKLGESAQSITEVTGLIQDITKQINVLALNAAIQAASSGESGREFTIVAQEVQRLAIDSESATKKIAEIISEIQSDTQMAVASMEKTTQEVVAGAQLTDKAGNALKEIEKLANTVAERVADAADKLEEKSSEMANVSLEMQKLQEITEDSSNIIKLAADQVESLKQISQKLENSVSSYKVE